MSVDREHTQDAGAAAANAPIISARTLDPTFRANNGPVEALSDVNLQTNKGDFVSFIGSPESTRL